MNKNVMSVLAVVIVAYGIAANSLQIWPFGLSSQQSAKSVTDSQENEICIQVVTFAVNPRTGEIEQFPNPCDVPDGWEIVEADIINDN